MNIDHCNTHSSFKDTVRMSNLCQEITLPTEPIDHIDDSKGEIALCIPVSYTHLTLPTIYSV